MQTAQEAAFSITSPVSQPEMGRHIILHGVSWATYESLLADFQDSNAAHFAYDRGTLEIMAPSAKHEEPNRTLALLVEMLALELHINIRNLGSTTFTRKDLQRGFEPDTCFYIRNVEQIRGKEEIDLTIDPPPDLVLEIDITHPSLNKLPIYAAVGVPEIWRYDGQHLTIFTLKDNTYHQQEESLAFPHLTHHVLVQEWARKQKL